MVVGDVVGNVVVIEVCNLDVDVEVSGMVNVEVNVTGSFVADGVDEKGDVTVSVAGCCRDVC